MKMGAVSTEFEARAADALRALLGRFSAIKLIELQHESQPGCGFAAIHARIEICGHRHTLACQAHPHGEPARLRAAFCEVQDRLPESQDSLREAQDQFARSAGQFAPGAARCRTFCGRCHPRCHRAVSLAGGAGALQAKQDRLSRFPGQCPPDRRRFLYRHALAATQSGNSSLRCGPSFIRTRRPRSRAHFRRSDLRECLAEVSPQARGTSGSGWRPRLKPPHASAHHDQLGCPTLAAHLFPPLGWDSTNPNSRALYQGLTGRIRPRLPQSHPQEPRKQSTAQRANLAGPMKVPHTSRRAI